jgi:hypothetical protein
LARNSAGLEVAEAAAAGLEMAAVGLSSGRPLSGKRPTEPPRGRIGAGRWWLLQLPSSEGALAKRSVARGGLSACRPLLLFLLLLLPA